MVKFSSYVITGVINKWDTPKGRFMVNQKARNVTLVGPDYARRVAYWMPFIRSEYGIHDGWWREEWEFGLSGSRRRGSHGCVNLPASKMPTLYNRVKVGTPVIII